MNYDIDLQTKLKGPQVDELWNELLSMVLNFFQTCPTPSSSQIEEACEFIARDLNLYFYRVDNFLNFCDRELAKDFLN